MKRILKLFVAWVLTLALMLPGVLAFAEDTGMSTDDAANAELEYKYSDYIKSIAKNIALFGRYDDIVENNLYLTALDAIIAENPELFEVAVRAMVESIDENSMYFNESEVKAFMESLDDEVVGIGVTVLDMDGNVVVSQPVPGSPADKAGIRSGDIIVAADDVVLTGMALDEAIEYIRGKEGTAVKITVKRSGMKSTLDFVITRESVTTESLKFELIEQDDKKIAMIKVYSFTENVAAQFKDALDKVDAAGTKKLIIDLRDNGGGYLDQAVAMADMLLPKDKLITTEDHKVDVLDSEYISTGIGREYEIVILINGMSASASEVLTAALVENNAAVAIGEKSFGKGTVQAVYDVPFNAMMKFTVAYYLTPNGNNIHQKGIVPNAVVNNSTVPMDMSEFEYFDLTRTYRVGDTGDEVLNAKKMLSTMGLYIGEINDVYDENLEYAVTMFQSAMELYPYGVLDITTQLNLYDKLKALEVEVDDQLQAAIDSL